MDKTIYSEEYKRLIERLKEARIAAGLTQDKVATMLDTTQSYISKVESGQIRIDAIQLKYFSRLYGKSLNYFIKNI